ncbi:uncharacterized protein LOC121900817 [Scomber scombrus]|uniref:Uncharacterized protein LOC121900817 n=2 Tax=Scomber scombrus TaxID=13677 RepID=A0AAV1QE31_SCOSC
MMKLILSLTLIWTLSSTAEALQCWQSEGDSRWELRPCDSTDLCASVAAQGYVNQNLQQITNRLCLPSSLFSEGKHTYSYNVGFETMTVSVHVCNTDGCNSEDIPFPDVQKKNNLKCFTSDDPSSAECNQTVQCEGVQDRCFSGTAEDIRGTFHTFGCVSANLCEILSHLELPFPYVEFLRAPTCCGSSFCNSA